jgi:hypothetical protein
MRAFQALTALAAPIGLCAQPDKCTVYSEDPAAAASVATALSMHHAPDLLLAAGIGRPSTARGATSGSQSSRR